MAEFPVLRPEYAISYPLAVAITTPAGFNFTTLVWPEQNANSTEPLGLITKGVSALASGLNLLSHKEMITR